MPNPRHVAYLEQGAAVWNRWRKQNPRLIPDLNEVDVNSVNLNMVDLESADLRGANLFKADLGGANLSKADLKGADLRGANLSKADLIEAKCIKSDLTGANLIGVNSYSADLDGAKLNLAHLNWANLSGAKMRSVDLGGADLSGANLSGADLSGANLQSATLQRARLDSAVLSGANLWETQRAGWSIKSVICERIYWDQYAKKPTEYAQGEFERLYSDQTCIELFYDGGISTFELNTLPALLHSLASKHPDARIRLQTIEATGGGTRVKISLGDANEATKTLVENDAALVIQAQLTLRTDEVRRLQFERDFFQSRLDHITNALLAAAAPQIHFHAPVHTAALPSGNATVELHQTFNDTTELVQLIDKLLTHNAALTAPQSREIEATKAELQKPSPDKSLLTRSLDFLKSLPKEAILKGAGKLGERAAEADWSSLLHQFGEIIHHLH